MSCFSVFDFGDGVLVFVEVRLEVSDCGFPVFQLQPTSVPAPESAFDLQLLLFLVFVVLFSPVIERLLRLLQQFCHGFFLGEDSCEFGFCLHDVFAEGFQPDCRFNHAEFFDVAENGELFNHVLMHDD